MKIGHRGERRKFLKNAITFGGLIALLGVIRPPATGRKKSKHQPGETSLGYRLTDHIKKYYETARL